MQRALTTAPRVWPCHQTQDKSLKLSLEDEGVRIGPMSEGTGMKKSFPDDTCVPAPLLP